MSEYPKARISTTMGDMVVELWNDVAPGHVDNFTKLAGDGFYDNLIFHRIIPQFVIQGGCPNGTGTGGPGWNVKNEFNDRQHVEGTLSMARSADPDSAGSQFFVCHGEAGFLDGQYTAFGRLVDGFEVLDEIANAPTLPGGEGSRPKDPVTVTKAVLVESTEG